MLIYKVIIFVNCFYDRKIGLYLFESKEFEIFMFKDG